MLASLPYWALSHSFASHDADVFKGRDVCVIGSGASAIDTAAELYDSGAAVRIVARSARIRYHSAPDPEGVTLLKQIQRPNTGIGPGWRSFFCANTPLLFHRMPQALRLRATKRHLGPAPGWFMRERIEGRVPSLLEQEVLDASVDGKRVVLSLRHADGTRQKITCDHVVAATGYRPSMRKLPFLAEELRKMVAAVQYTPILSDVFESSVDGLYAVGPLAANSFGPLMRFMVGAEFAAPRLANHLNRKLGAVQKQQAA